MDWQFNCITDNGISGSVKKPEWNWCNAESSELLSGDECSVNETVCETRVHKCCNGNGSIRSEVSCRVKEFGLERVDALRHSSPVAPMRSMQPWFSAGAKGLLPIFLTL